MVLRVISHSCAATVSIDCASSIERPSYPWVLVISLIYGKILKKPHKKAQESMPACPICHKASAEAHKPFCSPRCREVDLNKWFTASYAVPAVELDDVDEESLAAAAELLANPPDEA